MARVSAHQESTSPVNDDYVTTRLPRRSTYQGRESNPKNRVRKEVRACSLASGRLGYVGARPSSAPTEIVKSRRVTPVAAIEQITAIERRGSVYDMKWTITIDGKWLFSRPVQNGQVSVVGTNATRLVRGIYKRQRPIASGNNMAVVG